MSKISRNVKSVEELEQVIDVYYSNGFQLKSRDETGATLVKKNKNKKYKWNLITMVIACCTLFVVPILYNLLNNKNQKVRINLVEN